MPPQRQTQSYLRSLFARKGISPRHRFGQNFLIDLNIHDLIVKAAEVGPGDVVLEVGPGAGALTSLMAETGATVVAVDIDPAMAELTADATRGMINVRVLNVDALAGKNKLNPEVLDNVRSGLAVAPGRRFKLVANLPYNVATPIISNLLVHPDLCPTRVIATIQLELAQRMMAEPDSEHYGALSVLVRALTDFSLVRTLPPSVFWPRPNVDSAIISLVPNPEKRAQIGDLAWFHSVVRRIFLHRRKNLRRVLYSLWRDRWTKAEVDQMLEEIGLTGLVRAEAMNVEEHIALAAALRRRLGPGTEVEGENDTDVGGPEVSGEATLLGPLSLTLPHQGGGDQKDSVTQQPEGDENDLLTRQGEGDQIATSRDDPRGRDSSSFPPGEGGPGRGSSASPEAQETDDAPDDVEPS